MNNHTFNYVYPPDFEKAHQHRLANRIFKGDLETNDEQCECCGKRIGEQMVQTSCNIDPSQLSFLGPGIPLFFLFLKFIILLLAVMSIFFMGFAIYSNAASNDCGTISSCIPDLFNTLSLINKRSKSGYLEVQTYLGLVFVIACILCFHYFRYKARQLMQECDEVVDSPSDYAIILRRLPKDVTEAEIRQLVEEKKAELTPAELDTASQLKINKIVLSYSLKQYTRVKEKNMENFKTCVKEDRPDEFKYEELPKPTETSQIAIVVFESQAAKEFFIYEPTTSQKILQFFCTPCIPLSESQIRGERIGMERAPEPDEIYWQNSGITMKGAISRKSITGAVSVVVLLVGGGTQYGLSLLSSSSPDSIILTTASSLIVTIFNVILLLALGFLTKKERNETETEDQTVLMVKVTIFQFLNAGIFVIIAEIAASYATFTLNKGICSQITLIMILNAIIPNATLFFLEYSEIINKVFRLLVEKRWLIYSQVELNQIYIGSAIQLPYKYAYILKTLWLTALYSPLIPVVIGVSMLGLILFYFVEKFLYTRSYCMPSNVSAMSFESAVELLQYFLITFALGELIIYYYFYNFQYDVIPLTWTATILATVSLAILNSVLPMEAVNKYLFPVSTSSKSELTYSQIQEKLEVTYEMTNPACEVKRKRNFKKNIGVVNKNDSKAVAIELTNLFHDSTSKNNESFMTQKPLLNDFIERQSEEEKKERRENKEMKQMKESKESKGSKKMKEMKESKETKDSNHVMEQEIIHKDGKQQSKSNMKTESKVMRLKVGKVGNPALQKHEVQAEQQIDEQGILDGSFESSEQRQPLPPPIDNPKKIRKYGPQGDAPIPKKIFEIVDPFQDLSSFQLPRFVIRQRQEEAILQQQKKQQQKQEKKKAEAERFQKKPPKHSQQSTIVRPLLPTSPSGTPEGNLENVYANILTKPEGKAFDPNEKKLNSIHIPDEGAPIQSKYHKSGGKVNIYEQFIDPKYKSAIQQHNKPLVRRKPKDKEKDKEKQEHFETEPPKTKTKANQFKFVVINEVSIKQGKKNHAFIQQSSMPDQRNGILGLPNIQKRNTQSQKTLKIEEQDVNEAFKDAFGKNSNMNSRSSLHNDPGSKKKKEEIKEKKAIYNPIAIEGSYKKYFRSKYDSEAEENFEGFLDKKVVMSYIGTPFVNLAKNLPQAQGDSK